MFLKPRGDGAARAQLRDAAGFSPPIYRFAPSAVLAGLIRRYWLPVWSLPEGDVSTQRVLPFPVCHLVIASTYARLVGPASGLSERTLTGSGWAFGTMLQPAAGWMLLGRPVGELTDTHAPVEQLPGGRVRPLPGRCGRRSRPTPPTRFGSAGRLN